MWLVNLNPSQSTKTLGSVDRTHLLTRRSSARNLSTKSPDWSTDSGRMVKPPWAPFQARLVPIASGKHGGSIADPQHTHWNPLGHESSIETTKSSLIPNHAFFPKQNETCSFSPEFTQIGGKTHEKWKGMSLYLRRRFITLDRSDRCRVTSKTDETSETVTHRPVDQP